VCGKSFIFFRERDLPDITYRELSEVVQDAWLSRASTRRAAEWLKSRGLAPPGKPDTARPR